MTSQNIFKTVKNTDTAKETLTDKGTVCGEYKSAPFSAWTGVQLPAVVTSIEEIPESDKSSPGPLNLVRLGTFGGVKYKLKITLSLNIPRYSTASKLRVKLYLDGEYNISANGCKATDLQGNFIDNFTLTGTGAKYIEADVTALVTAKTGTVTFYAQASGSEFVTLQSAEFGLDAPSVSLEIIPGNFPQKKQVFMEGDVGGAGSYKVNARNGLLQFSKQLFANGGNIMPLDVSLHYNEANRDDARYFGFPKGWQLNYHRFVTYQEEHDCYYYTDGTGVVHSFFRADNCLVTDEHGDKVFIDSGGTGLILDKKGSYVYISDERGNTIRFASHGYADQMTSNVNGTTMSVTLTYFSAPYLAGPQLTSVTDGMGNVMSITYNGDNVTLTNSDGTKYTLWCQGDRLIGIDDPDGSRHTYGDMFNFSENALTEVLAADGEKAVFSSTEQNFTVADRVVKGNSDSLIRRRTTAWQEDRYTVTDDKGIVYVYEFDESGELLDSYEQISGWASNYVYIGNEKNSRLSYRVGTQSLVSEKFCHSTRLMIDAGAEEPTTRTGTFTPLNPVNNGENPQKYRLFAACTINGTPPKEDGVLRELEFCLYKVEQDGKRDKYARLVFDPYTEKTQYKSALFETNENIADLKWLACNNGDLGSAVFKQVKILAVRDEEVVGCINVNTGGKSFSETQYNGQGTPDTRNVWYKVPDTVTVKWTNPTANEQQADLTMTAEDWQRNIENCGFSNGEFNFFYNGLKSAVRCVCLVKLLFGETEISFSSVKYASVTPKADGVQFVYSQVASSFQTVYNVYRRDRVVQKADGTEYTEMTLTESKAAYNSKGLPLWEITDRGIKTEYAYDVYGNCTSQTVYNTSSSADNIKYTCTYTADGKQLASEKEYRLLDTYQTTYAYDDANGNLVSQTDAAGQTYSHAYTADKRLQSISATLATEGQTCANGFTYTDGLVSGLSHNGFSYGFTYDNRNNVNSVKAGTETLLDKNFVYNSDGTSYADSVLPNGYTERKTYDKYGRLVKVSSVSGGVVSDKLIHIYSDYTLDGNVSVNDPFDVSLAVSSASLLRKSIDLQSGRTTYYAYDVYGEVADKQVKLNSTGEQTYRSRVKTTDAFGRVKEKETYVNEVNISENAYNYENKADGRITSERATFFTNSHYTTQYAYDGLDRIAETTFTAYGSYGHKRTYGYYDRQKITRVKKFETGVGLLPVPVLVDVTVNDGTTPYVKYIGYYTKSGSSYVSQGQDFLSYDSKGNITVYDGRNNAYARYGYDKLNRLIREDNKLFNKTVTWEYDGGGNITCRREYAYTTSATLGTAVKTVNYGYGNSQWKDKLTSFNGQAITYDGAGNPLSYRNATLTWQGRLPITYKANGWNWALTNTYDGEGIRRKKHRNLSNQHGRTVEYIYDGGKLVYESRVTAGLSGQYYTNLLYTYDQEGITGLARDTGGDPKAYWFVKNYFGDVTEIWDTTGIVARYAYDARGNCKVLNPDGTENTAADFIGNENPIRYRGYYWDSDMEMYYLLTRFYDPETGRFISPDAIEYLDPATLNGLNLYSYCLNNPVMRVDPTGTFPWLFAIVLLAVVAIAVAAIGTLATSTQEEVVYYDTMDDLANSWIPGYDPVYEHGAMIYSKKINGETKYYTGRKYKGAKNNCVFGFYCAYVLNWGISNRKTEGWIHSHPSSSVARPSDADEFLLTLPNIGTGYIVGPTSQGTLPIVARQYTTQKNFWDALKDMLKALPNYF